ncbi:MAG: pilus assembly protein PilP [Rubrivivax sp.]
MRRGLRVAGLGLGAALLASGCTQGFDELQAWIDTERRSARPQVRPLQSPRQFTPEGYEGAKAADPFSTQKLSVVLRQEAAQPNSVIAAELNRRREPLEAYPLDTMTMVGSLARQGRAVALLRVDNLLHMVKAGDYLGQNYGRVTKIDETRVEVRELVQDAAGEWVTRPAVLYLQDRAR